MKIQVSFVFVFAFLAVLLALAGGAVPSALAEAPSPQTIRKLKMMEAAVKSLGERWNRRFELEFKLRCKKILGNDPRIPSILSSARDESPCNGFYNLAVGEKLEVKVSDGLREYIDKNFSEKDVKRLKDALSSLVVQKLIKTGDQLDQIIQRETEDFVRRHYVDVVRIPYQTTFPSPVPSPLLVQWLPKYCVQPSPSPAPSLVPSPSPSPSPSPVRKMPKVEPSWLTKMIWKYFPETNCGCSGKED